MSAADGGPATVAYLPVGRRSAVVALRGACTGADVLEELIAAVVRAVEADRTVLALDMRGVAAIDAELRQAVLDVHGVGEQDGWGVGIVRPRHFTAIPVEGVPLFRTRIGALIAGLAARSGTLHRHGAPEFESQTAARMPRASSASLPRRRARDGLLDGSK